MSSSFNFFRRGTGQASEPPNQGPKRRKQKNKKAQPQPKSKGAKKIILKGPGMKAAYQAILEAERAAAAVKQPAPVVAEPAIPRETIFRQIIAAVRNTTPMIEPRPVSITPQNQAAIERAIIDGAAQLSEKPQPDVDDGFIVGFDFWNEFGQAGGEPALSCG
ncbi:hypothetical protein ACFSTD_00125 [Novosphingobium colocasiae]